MNILPRAISLVLALCLPATILGASEPPDPVPACVANIAERPEVTVLKGKVTLAGVDGPSFEMLADTSRPTSEEKVAISFWGKARQDCIALGEKWRDSYLHYEERAIFERVYATVNGWTADLYNGRLTYGEYERKRTELRIEANRQLAEVASRMTDRRAAKESPPPPTDPYVAQLVARCSAMGAPASYDERTMDRHIACVERLHVQEQQRNAAEGEALRRTFPRRETTTNCRRDGLGGVVCTTR